MNVAKRIKERRKELNISADDLAEAIGVNRATIYRYESGDISKIPINVIEPLAKALKTTPPFLMGWEEPNQNNELLDIYNQLEPPRQDKVYDYAEYQLKEQSYNHDYIEEPYYRDVGLYGAVSAGSGQMVYDNPTEYISIPVEDIPKEDYDMMLKVVGDSMEPAFKDSEYIFVKKTPDVRSGQFVVAIVDDEAYIKKLYIEKDHIKLVSLNPDYEDIIVDNYELLDIIGVVVL